MLQFFICLFLISLMGCHQELKDADSLKPAPFQLHPPLPDTQTSEAKKERVPLPYQLGSFLGKKDITQELLQNLSPETYYIRQLARSTAQAMPAFSAGSIATSFYIGEFNGRHLMVSNNHVMDSSSCNGMIKKSKNPDEADRDVFQGNVFFFPEHKKFRCKKVLVDKDTLPALDISIFEIYIPLETREADEAYLLDRKLTFDFSAEAAERGTPILTAGYGKHQNPDRRLQYDISPDCRIFSNTFKIIRDVDPINPSNYKIWSMAHGCATSHNDSGSPLLNRKTGKVVGIEWTAGPSTLEFQDSTFLATLSPDDDRIWQYFNYAVPAHKLYELLTTALNEGKIQEEDQSTLRLLLHPSA